MTLSPPGPIRQSQTLPRGEYALVRDLHPNQKVRVRGYLSKWFAQGCSWFSRTSHRFLWVDSIDVVKDPSPALSQGEDSL